MKRIMLAPVAAALAFVLPTTAGAATSLRGVVIARLPSQGQIVIAGQHGGTTTLRAPVLPPLGTIVRASAFGLSDGTSATQRLIVLGHTREARFHGVLVRTAGATSFWAAGRSVVAVAAGHRSLASGRSLASAAPLQPGDAADVEVTISGGTLDQASATPTPAGNTAQVQLQVTIAAVTPATATVPGSVTLTINGQTLTIPLPAGSVLPPSFVANATVGLNVEFKQNGTVQGAQGDNEDDNSSDDDAAGIAPMPPSTTAPPAGGTTTTTPTTTTSTFTGTATSGGHDGGHGHDGGGDD